MYAGIFMKKTAILFFLLIAFSALSQERYHRLSIQDYHMETRVMNADISAHALDFEGAYLDDNFGLLPVYIYRFPLKPADPRILHVHHLNDGAGKQVGIFVKIRRADGTLGTEGPVHFI